MKLDLPGIPADLTEYYELPDEDEFEGCLFDGLIIPFEKLYSREFRSLFRSQRLDEIGVICSVETVRKFLARKITHDYICRIVLEYQIIISMNLLRHSTIRQESPQA